MNDEGKPIVINVEMIGHALMVQGYAVEIATPALCKMVSVSEAFTPNGRTRVQVVCTLSINRIDENTCEFANRMTVHPTTEFIRLWASLSRQPNHWRSIISTWIGCLNNFRIYA